MVLCLLYRINLEWTTVMTGTNHALTGAVIVATISVPVIALPLAFLSHFALDSLPHFGEPYGKRKNKITKIVWSTDLTLLSMLLIGLVITSNWLLLLGALLAISPDFAWIYRFTIDERFGNLPPKPTNRFNSFHAGIQKYETKKGLIVEVFWLILFSITLINTV